MNAYTLHFITNIHTKTNKQKEKEKTRKKKLYIDLKTSKLHSLWSFPWSQAAHWWTGRPFKARRLQPSNDGTRSNTLQQDEAWLLPVPCLQPLPSTRTFQPKCFSKSYRLPTSRSKSQTTVWFCRGMCCSNCTMLGWMYSRRNRQR